MPYPVWHTPTSAPPAHPVPPAPPGPYPSAYALPPVAPRKSRRGRRLAVVGISVAVVAAGLVGAELIARNRAATAVADSVKCMTGDTSTVSIAAMPPFLWQYATGTYNSIRIQTAGNRIRDVRGMAVDIALHDVRPPSDSSAGSVGSATADLSWDVAGIKETVQHAVPAGGKLLTDVTASPQDGTIKLGNFLVSVTVKPKVLDNGGITLDVVSTAGPGMGAIETLQPALDSYLGKQTTLPLGLHAEKVSVTDHGVSAHLSSTNASLPADSEKNCYTAQ